MSGLPRFNPHQITPDPDWPVPLLPAAEVEHANEVAERELDRSQANIKTTLDNAFGQKHQITP